MQEACAIRQAIEDIARTKGKSLGLSPGSRSESDTESETDSESTICSLDMMNNSQEVVLSMNQLSIVDLTNGESRLNNLVL